MQIAGLLLTANWLIGFSGIGIILVVIIRIPEEEKLLTEQFGPQYQDYITHTSRLFPKVR